MKGHLFFLLCAILSASLAVAQEQKPPRMGHGYAFAAPGAVTEHGYSAAFTHFGVGGEVVAYKGLGIGGEIGYLFANRCTSCGLGLGSFNAYYQIKGVGSARKIVPFITGGVSAAIGEGGLGGGFNFGGGVNYWLRRRLGLRMEFRDHIPVGALNAHLWEARGGIAF